MTCARCPRPARLSGRSPLCIICKRGRTVRLRYRKLSGNEKEQQRRMLARKVAA